MTDNRGDSDAVQVIDEDGQPITCDECKYGLFMVDLLIPGGLRFTCRGCDTRYDKRQLEQIGRRLQRSGE